MRLPRLHSGWTRIAGCAVFAAAALAACSSDPIDITAPSMPLNDVVSADTPTVTARVTSAAGDVCDVCMWLADDAASQQRGLMGITDLGDKAGMAFVWEQPQSANFYMFQTLSTLSIAWFDIDGSHIGEQNMEPCLVDDPARCERYSPDEPYVVALEVFEGQLDTIGIGPGSSVELLDRPCA